MKKLFFVLTLLLALFARAAAAEITLQATTIPNANFAGISDVSGVCAVSNGSSVVTSNNAFAASWVGIGGFKITILGALYTVESVQSRSQLKLTTPYAASTNTSAAFTLHKYVLLRVYALERFTPAGATSPVQVGAPGSGQFYKQVGCSVISDGATSLLHIPSLTLPSTTDAQNPNERGATYFAGFYTPGGGAIKPYDCFESFALREVPTTTTWSAVCQFNNPGGGPPPERDAYAKSQTYSKSEIDALLAAISPGGIGGSISASQVAVGSGPNTISGSGALTFNGGVLNVVGAIRQNGVGVATLTGAETFSNKILANTVSFSGFTDFTGIGVPSNPGAGIGRVFFNSATGKLACRDSAGVDCMPAGGGGGGGGGSIGGSIALNQVAVGAGPNTISGSSALTFASNSLSVSSASAQVIATDGSSPPSFTALFTSGLVAQKTSATAEDTSALTFIRLQAASDYPDNNYTLGVIQWNSANASLGGNPVASLTLTAAQNHNGAQGGSGLTLALAPNGSITQTTRLLVSGAGAVAIQPGARTFASSFGPNTLLMVGEVESPLANTSIQFANLDSANRTTLAIQQATGQTNPLLQFTTDAGNQLQAFVVASSRLEQRFNENPANGNQVTGLRAANSIGSDFTLTLPDALPVSTQCITVDTSGNMAYGACSGGASAPFVDTTSIVEGSGDNTKEIRFEVDGLTTGTVRVLTPPDANITIAGADFANAWADGVRQTFNPNGTNAGFNPGSHTADPSSPQNGDMLYRSDTNELRARINGAWVSLGAGGGGGSAPGAPDNSVQYRVNGTTFGGISGVSSDGTNMTAGSGNLRATRPRFTTSIDGSSGNEVLGLSDVASAVNELGVSNASSGNDPFMAASGGDSNVQILLLPKGNGSLVVGQTNSGTSATARVVGIFVNSTGTPAAGFGSTIDNYLESNGANDRLASQIVTRWTTATDGPRTSAVDINVVNSASTVTALTIFPTSLGLPATAGAAPTADGNHAYDTTLDAYVGGVSGATIVLSSYDVPWSFLDKPGVNQVVLRFVAPRPFVVPSGTISNGTNAPFKAATAATAQADFLLQKNGATICTYRFAASATQATYQSCSLTSFAVGDVLTLVAPGSQDATLANGGGTAPGLLR